MQRKSIEDRFWAKVEKSEDGCWAWTGVISRSSPKHTYGTISLGPSTAGAIGAHRFSYQLAFGPIPDGLSVCHRCDTPRCVRPDHLFLGSHAENMRDEALKDRAGRAKITNAQVIEIRQRYAQGGIKQKDLAREFGLYPKYVSEIIRRVRRPHLP